MYVFTSCVVELQVPRKRAMRMMPSEKRPVCLSSPEESNNLLQIASFTLKMTAGGER